METDEWIDQQKQSDNSPSEINQKVHHHARLDNENGLISQGVVKTLCGMQIKPRSQAKNYPCCPLCALLMDKPCK